MKFIQFAISAIALTGCGVSSEPSISDVEKNVKNIFKDCKNVRAGNFEKINGVTQGEGQYLIFSEFTLKVSPVEINKNEIEKVIKIRDRSRPLYNEFMEKSEKLLSESRSLGGKMYNANEEIRASQEYAEMQKRVVEIEENNLKLMRKYKDAIQEWGAYGSYFESPGVKISSYAELLKECKVPNTVFVSRLFNGIFENAENFGKEVEKKFKVDIKMIKTDKGWVMQENLRG